MELFKAKLIWKITIGGSVPAADIFLSLSLSLSLSARVSGRCLGGRQ